MKLLFFLAIVFSLAPLLSDRLFSQTDYEIQKINIVGNQTFSSDILLAKMSMYQMKRIEKDLLGKKQFAYDEEIINDDLKKLENFYQREGFLNIAVSLSETKFDHNKQRVDLTLAVTEGEPILVGVVDFQLFSKKEQNTARLSQTIHEALESGKLKAGSRFRDDDLEIDKNHLLDALADAGYAQARVIPELELVEQENTVKIHWKVNPGQKYFFGNVTLSGNQKVSSSSILKQMQFKPGEVYNKKALDKTQEHIQSLGLFNSVTVKAIVIDSAQSVLPVSVHIIEAPQLTTRFGLGYGSEEKFRTFLNFQRLAFLGGARQGHLMLKYSSLEPYNINLIITQPQFLTYGTTLSLNPFLRKEVEPSYTARRLGFNIPIGHRFNRKLQGSLTLFYEKVDQESNSLDPVPVYTDDETFYNKSGYILGFIWDSSRPMFNPDQGMFVAFNYKINGSSFNADYPYNKLLVDVRRYSKFSKAVLAYRIKIGGIVPNNPDNFIPQEERFYSGGSISVRGWYRSELGPLDENQDPIGGNSLLEGSLEARLPLQGSFSWAIFLDAGNVWENSYTYKLEEIRYSLGAGLRFSTPIGPVRLDVAWPIDEVEKSTKFYIDVGHAF